MLRKLRSITHIFSEPHYRHNPRWLLTRIRRSLRPEQPGLKTVTLPWGVELRVNPDEFIGASIWATGVHDIAVSEALWRLVDDGDTAVDAGANIGYMTSIMAVRAGPRGRVLAFEPHPVLFQQLRHNAALLSAHESICKPELYQVGLSDRGGRALLVTDREWDRHQGLAHIDHSVHTGEHERPTGTATEVELERLDDIVGDQPISVLKVDVEGHEAEVLRGASRLFDTQRVKTVIYEERSGIRGASHQILSDAGYTVLQLDSNLAGPLVTKWRTKRIRPAPDFLATLAPDEIERRFKTPGWQLFKSPNRELAR
jgi:FkbM family methyltransferase